MVDAFIALGTLALSCAMLWGTVHMDLLLGKRN